LTTKVQKSFRSQFYVQILLILS